MHSIWGGALAIVVLLGGCASEKPASPGVAHASPTATSASPAPTPTPVATARLDSMAVLGHSGATGTMSNPQDPGQDATENVWATGDNPQVESIYLRLLEEHPALEGHNYNYAENGTTVDSLQFQFESLLADANPLPDVILIQTIDNDIRCDGTDAENYGPFAGTLDRTLSQMEKAIPQVQFFIVSQWATVARWTAWAAHHEEQVLANSGTGPCAVFDDKGRPRPAVIRSMQKIVDAYWAQVQSVCKAHPGCFTDGGAEARFVPTDRDVAADLNHLSVAGHRKFAAIAWQAFPEEIKRRR
jgi:hypothetical protein